MIQDSEFYNTVSRDSMSWIDNSEKLKFSADLIQKEFQKLIKPFLNGQSDYTNEEEIIALWNSYFLLVGFALENLIKGLSVENHREAKDFNEIYNLYWKDYKSGHGISRIAKDNLNNLTDKELGLLEKLEIYIVWAGRYPNPISKSEKEFIIDKCNLRYITTDYEIINSLFLKIKDKLIEEWEKNEYK